MNLRKNSIALRFTRETLLDLGVVEPTPEEAEQRRRQREAWAKRRRDAQPRLRAALAELDAIQDHSTRAIRDLHCRQEDGTCYGCDHAGYDSEPPDWPCRTIGLIAELNDIDLDDFYLYEHTEEPRP